MSADLLNAARAEEQRLLKELEATALFRRLQAVRAVLAEYETAPERSAASPRARRQTVREPSLTTQIIVTAEDYLRQIQRRAQSLEILQVAQQRGIEVKGNKPTTVVASILSHCDTFDNVRGEGYGLREWSAGTAESGGPTDESDDPLGSDQTEQPSRGDDVDSGAQFGVHNNGATSDHSWPPSGR
jgi:hypothetical protein